MPSSGTPLEEVSRRLAAAGCVAAADEAAELVAAAGDSRTLESHLARREKGEPLAWITGTTRFCGRAVRVDAGVFVPRAQSEGLARRAAALLRRVGRSPRAADLCTGSGAVAAFLLAACPGASVVGVDTDAAAARCAAANRVPVVVGHLGEPLASGAFDVVTAVAPYVPAAELPFLPADVQRWEPVLALDGGADGLEVLREVVSSAFRVLRPGGWLLVEVGGDQEALMLAELAGGGFESVSSWHDDWGDLRGLAARATPPPGGSEVGRARGRLLS